MEDCSKEKKKALTKEGGAPVANNQDSLTVGPRGPVLLEDLWLQEKMAHFDREVIPERRMHAKGWGAYGTFTVTGDITCYTKACLFQCMGKKTPMFVRFSTVAGERGAPDAVRDIRGFAMKFYTEEGIWDLVGNNTPVFFLRDGLQFPDLNHVIKRAPGSGLHSPLANWDFWTLLPEAFQQITILMTPELGIPVSFRYMDGFGSHTFSFYNRKQERYWVKFHLKSCQGVAGLTDAQAEEIRGKDPDSNGRDLFYSIAQGNYPRWTMYVQIMTEEEAAARKENPFDITKTWSEEEFPLKEVGVMELNRNPDNFFAEVEQAAFHPGHLVPGISISPDKLLQSRMFSYGDAQRYRLGVNHLSIPVNKSKNYVHAYHRDGAMRVDGNYGSTLSYTPNSFGQWIPDFKEQEPPVPVSGEIGRFSQYEGSHPEWVDDNFYQGGNRYRAMGEWQKNELIANTLRSMGSIPEGIKYRHGVHCYKADLDYGRRFARGAGLDWNKLMQYASLPERKLQEITGESPCALPFSPLT